MLMCAGVLAHTPAALTAALDIMTLFVRGGLSKLSEILTTHLGSVSYLIIHAFKSHNEVCALVCMGVRAHFSV